MSVCECACPDPGSRRGSPILVEALENIAPQSMRELYTLANRSKGYGAYDRTMYGRMRASPTSFVTHRTQQISKAAVVNASKAILKRIISRKQKACSCTPSTTGAAYAASGAWREQAPLWGSLVTCIVYCLRVRQC